MNADPTCGAFEEPCCDGDACGIDLQCVEGFCDFCGLPDTDCCDGDYCGFGAECLENVTCSARPLPPPSPPQPADPAEGAGETT